MPSSPDTPSPVELFGTTEPPPERRRLSAGSLSAILEDGNLRDIRFDGVEVVRAINYLSRDGSWGTYRPEISRLDVAERGDRFSVTYVGLCGTDTTGFRYEIRIDGSASGELVMEAVGTALGDFETNRTGFVVLHSADVAGMPMTIRHTDGSEELTAFPGYISADQPAFDIAAISHEPVPGLKCAVEMEGDAFEMEDQRNWADASFKTYVRPLSKSRPYVIAKGDTDRQSIFVKVASTTRERSASTSGDRGLHVGEQLSTMPSIGMFVDESGIGPAKPQDVPQKLLVRLDLESAATPRQTVVDLARRAGATLAVEIVFPARKPEVEAKLAFRALKDAGIEPAVLLVSPRREFRTRPSASLPRGEVSGDTLVEALRSAGFRGMIGAGTPSNFTEFNRNPPGAKGNFAFFGVSAIVHAADDVSVAETIDVYSALIESARALFPAQPIWLGPCTIGVRHNPYGDDVQPNPNNDRVPSARVDPRHHGLFGAAYAVAVASKAASSGVDTITLAAASGPFGVRNEAGDPSPILAAITELKSAAGSIAFRMRCPRGMHGIAWQSGAGLRAMLVNMSEAAVDLELPSGFEQWEILQTDASWQQREGSGLSLGPCRTARLSRVAR